MGRGDKRSRKGKIVLGSYGKTRKRAAQKAKKKNVARVAKPATA